MAQTLKQGKYSLRKCFHYCKQSVRYGLENNEIRAVDKQVVRHSNAVASTGTLIRSFASWKPRLCGYESIASIGRRNDVVKSSLCKVRGSNFTVQRSYYVDRSGIQHFKMRGPRAWIQGPEGGQASQRLLIFIALVGGTLTIVYVTHLQTVPYTNRKHFVLISPATERMLGEMSYRELAKEFKGKILPQYHPEVIRVSRISQKIIESAMMGIRAQDWGKLEHGRRQISDVAVWGESGDQGKKKDLATIGEITHKDLYAEDDTLDETWVEKSREEGLKQGRKASTEHLEGMKWEVLVVDAPVVNAVCMPGGKIMVFTGLLKHFRTDEEIATVLAHEVAHALARHSAETLTRSIFLGFFEILLLLFINAPGAVSTVSNILLRLPFSRRMETEADHIGLLVMASAGYDPRIAPSVYEKLGQLEKVPEYAQYISTHPSGKKRAELLRKSSTMSEALHMYREKVVGRQAEGYLFL